MKKSSIIPENGQILSEDTSFEPGVYFLPDGLAVGANGITIDGNGALLVGQDQRGTGLRINNRQGVTIRNLHVQSFYHGLYISGCHEIVIEACQVHNTAEIPANTHFLDVWKSVDECYGSGILLRSVTDSILIHCDLQHQMNGLLCYNSHRLKVQENNASYCSGWGFHLCETSDSVFERNWADYCCRYQPRSETHGHLGADAAGFLITTNSCNNTFQQNRARLCGDGFFLAGLTPQLELVGCNDNLFIENDGSYSPNIAFEGTFSKGNIYRNNIASHCNYGFWLGFSQDIRLEGNQMAGNYQAGIAVENGCDFMVAGNTFQNNGHGILLWSKRIPAFETAVPQNDTSRNWQIKGNLFNSNTKAIRIAANQDHGIRPLPASGECGLPAPAPHHHVILQNRFMSNTTILDSCGVVDTQIDRAQTKGNSK